MSKYEELHSTCVANCVFSRFLCYTGIMLNIVAIYAIRETSFLPKSLKVLLLSLPVCDVYVYVLVYWVSDCRSHLWSRGYNGAILANT